MSWVFDEEVLAVIMAIAVVAAVFAASQALYAGRVAEPFSELGLLGPAGKIGDYPRSVEAGSPILLNVYIGNHEGRAVYYKVLVKVGDASSTVNASRPLSAEPIMDVRAVLRHNSSRVIPVNVTLYEPGIRRRLVFEMWIYDEDAGAFRYHGRWNQLWVNVTEPATPTGPGQRGGAPGLSPEVELSTIEAYLAVRRAERAGGDPSEMIDLLNAAIDSAARGDVEEAKGLLGAVLLLEPKVTEAGLELSRLKLYTTLASVAALSAACAGAYLYLRSNAWLLWARARRGWRVVQCGEGPKGGPGGEAAKPSRRGRELTVDELINGPGALDPDARRAARELYRMVRAGKAKLYDPDPPRSFPSFLLSSAYSAGFIASLAVLAAGVACIYLSEPASALARQAASNPALSTLSAAVTYARYALGSVMVLFLPGYSLVEALYPSEGELSPLERLALSIGLSLALVPLVGLVLNYTPWGIRLNSVVAALTLLSTALLLVSAYRKFALVRSRASASSG